MISIIRKFFGLFSEASKEQTSDVHPVAEMPSGMGIHPITGMPVDPSYGQPGGNQFSPIPYVAFADDTIGQVYVL